VVDKLERRSANVKIGERPAPRGSASSGEPKEAVDDKGNKLTLEEMPKETRPTRAEQRPALGLKLSELTPQIANERNLKGVRGLYVQDVDQAGIAFDAGVQKSMVIQRINRQSVGTIEDFERVINTLKPGDPIVLHVSAYNGEKVLQQITVSRDRNITRSSLVTVYGSRFTIKKRWHRRRRRSGRVSGRAARRRAQLLRSTRTTSAASGWLPGRANGSRM
jgi:hypothetical protein